MARASQILGQAPRDLIFNASNTLPVWITGSRRRAHSGKAAAAGGTWLDYVGALPSRGIAADS